MKRWSIAWVWLLAATVALGCSDDSGGGDGGDGVSGTRFPALAVDPDRIVFPGATLGTTQLREVTFTNVGGGLLNIEEITPSDALGPVEFKLIHPPVPFQLAEAESATLRVEYTVADEGLDSGYITVRSNDRDEQNLRIPVETVESAAQLRVSPERLIFGSVESGESETLTVTISNIGNVPVAVTDIRLDAEGSDDFTLADGGELRPILERGDTLDVGVAYAPTGLGSDEGTLVISTDSEAYAELLVPLRGDEPSPEIEAVPERIAFGAVALNESSEIEPLRIRNIGSSILNISSIEFALAADGVNEQFALNNLPQEFPVLLAAGEEIELGVSYHPTVDASHQTGIAIHSNDLDENLLIVPVSGRVTRPCIAVLPEQVNFGAVALGIESAHQAVQIVNCGDFDLPIDNVRIESDIEGFTEDGERQANPLAPNVSYQFETWFTNGGLQERESAEGVLVIEHSDGETLRVPLYATGGGAPTCRLRAPNALNFGLVARGTQRTDDIEIISAGTGHCEIVSQTVSGALPPPLDALFPVPFTLDQGLAGPQLAPGSRNRASIAFQPEVWGILFGVYTLVYRDPFMMVENTVTVNLQGLGGDSNIEVIPGSLDFGEVTAGECASREERVTVYNTGIVDLCISGIALEGAGCNEFFVIDRPVADQDGCIRVTRNAPAEVRLQYEPGNLGVDNCDLIFESDDMDTPALRVPLRGEGVPDSAATDEFIQTSGQTVDVLVVIDNSGSMQEEQDNLRENFSSFISGAEQFDNDYQIGIVTTDTTNPEQSGRLQGNPTVVRRGPNVEAQFEASTEVGTGGDGSEKGLEAARLALSDPLAFDTGVACQDNNGCVEPDICVEGICGGYNRGFIRDNAVLEVIFLSDEDDASSGTLNFYVDFLKNIKGFRNENLFHAHAIVGAENGRAAECVSEHGSADAGRRYVDVATRTNGTIHSICDDSFGRSLRDIGNQAFGLPVQFFLSRPADPATVDVTVDGQPGQGWMFDEPSNSIIFDEAQVPQAGARIVVNYEAQCFQRR